MGKDTRYFRASEVTCQKKLQVQIKPEVTGFDVKDKWFDVMVGWDLNGERCEFQVVITGEEGVVACVNYWKSDILDMRLV